MLKPYKTLRIIKVKIWALDREELSKQRKCRRIDFKPTKRSYVKKIPRKIKKQTKWKKIAPYEMGETLLELGLNKTRQRRHEQFTS